MKDADLVVVEEEIDRLIESAFANQAYLSRVTSRGDVQPADVPPMDVPLAEMPSAAVPPTALPAAHAHQKEAAVPAANRTSPGRRATRYLLAAILAAVAGLAYFAYQPSSVRPNPPQEARVVNVPAQAAGGPITHLPAADPPAVAPAPASPPLAAPASPRPQPKRAASAVVPAAAPEASPPAPANPARAVVTHTRPAAAAVPPVAPAAPAATAAAPATVPQQQAVEQAQPRLCTQEMAALGFCTASRTAEAK